MTQNPIICALDTTDMDEAAAFTHQLRDRVGAFKLGLEFFTANGANGVREIAGSQAPVFLDLKFHDIPNTVSRAIKATAGLNTFMMTVHTEGGRTMLRSAIDASMEVAATTGKQRPLIIGVTLLTSLDQDDVTMLGFKDSLNSQVLRLADLAQSSGLDGVVCSAYEISLLRKHCGPDFVLVVPGIRPAGTKAGDQKRVVTPVEALERGANYLVIGRPITESLNPAQAVDDILATLRQPA